jgi:cytochrome c peroxidase
LFLFFTLAHTMPATRKPFLVGLGLLALTGCGRLADDLFCEREGCDWKPGEWTRVAALANPGPPPPDPSNKYLGDSAAELLGQAFFFDPAFSGHATQVDAIGRTSPPAHAAKCEPVEISCASCHDLARAGVDTMSVPGHVSVGAGWTDVNALGVVNSAYRKVVFWNGRADSLWALNAVVAESPTTLNGNRLRTAHQIAERYAPFYDAVFARDFGPIDNAAIAALPANGKPRAPEYESPALTEDQRTAVTWMLVNWAKAIAAYEYKLISRPSPFDKFVAAGPASDWIAPAAKRGARLFVGKAGCVDCHLGPQLTDEQFHNIGVAQAGPAVPRTFDCPATSDPNALCDCASTTAPKCPPWGAYDGLRRLRDSPWLRTGRWSDDSTDTSRQAYVDLPRTPELKGAWRTPSLRNVAQTAPYMHDGRYATLEEVIWHYNDGAPGGGGEQVNPDGLAPQLKPLLLSDGEVADLVAFLETLTGAPVAPELTVAPANVGLPTGLGGAGGACPTAGAGGAGGAGGATGMGGRGAVGGSIGPTGTPAAPFSAPPISPGAAVDPASLLRIERRAPASCGLAVCIDDVNLVPRP